MNTITDTTIGHIEAAYDKYVCGQSGKTDFIWEACPELHHLGKDRIQHLAWFARTPGSFIELAAK